MIDYIMLILLIICTIQNKLHDLHKQIDELTAKVGTLQSENSALHSRTNILEKVLDMRNEQIQVMQETKEVRNHPPCMPGCNDKFMQV
jgi:regulator of replication initiation timing